MFEGPSDRPAATLVVASLRVCRRVLRLSGTMSVAAPNARIYLDGYQSPAASGAGRYLRFEPAVTRFGRVDMVNYMASMCGERRCMFDEEHLLAVFRAVGFGRVSLRGFDPELDMAERDFESLYAVATKTQGP